MTGRLEYLSHGRNRRTVAALAIALILFTGLWAIGTSPWIIGFLSIFALPAAFDLVANPKASFSIDDSAMRWKTPLQTADVPLDQIRKVRFDTRLDVSTRITLMLVDGKKLRVPADASPPATQLQNVLQTLNIPTERHHFRVL